MTVGTLVGYRIEQCGPDGGGLLLRLGDERHRRRGSRTSVAVVGDALDPQVA